jgi:hypothetical protein
MRSRHSSEVATTSAACGVAMSAGVKVMLKVEIVEVPTPVAEQA